MLARDQRVFQKLREAIIHDFGSSPASGRPMNLAAFKSCKYLQYVIAETLRVYPPVPINNRKAVRDTILPIGGGPDGTKPMPIRKGQTVNFVIYAVQRRKDIWGEDADEFIPERWENKKYDWSYIP
jgi:cytochrome P450